MVQYQIISIFKTVNRYRRKRPKVDASIFDSALSHTCRSEASEKKEENSVSTFGRFRLWTGFESPHVSVQTETLDFLCHKKTLARLFGRIKNLSSFSNWKTFWNSKILRKSRKSRVSCFFLGLIFWFILNYLYNWNWYYFLTDLFKNNIK